MGMKAQCPNCGQWLELPARAATCPNCGTLVTIPVSPPPPGPRGFKPEPDSNYERAPRYEPTPPDEGMPEWVRSLILIGVIGFMVFGVVFYGIWKFTQKMNTPTATTTTNVPAPPAPTTPAPGPSSGSKVFDFNEKPATAPAPVLTPKPTPATIPTRPAPKRPATTAPMIALGGVPASTSPDAAITDESINASILRGAEFLMSRFADGKLKEGDETVRLGTNALCVLALLHAGQSINDERLNVHNPFLTMALDRLRGMDVPTAFHTYQRSLRAQALAVYNRKEDRAVLEADTRWLIQSGVKGAYAYSAPPAGTTQPSAIGWDNSNSQYGALGVWAAAEAGVSVPVSYWQDVQAHWESCQGKNGGWNYNAGGEGTLSMTSAGVNMLFVANEMISAQRPETQIARPPFSSALQAGLDWLGTADRSVTINSAYPSYTLYGMERAGLACGFKMFGTHDWYRELAGRTLKNQQENGSWGNEIETAFTMLFLSRGQHPLLMNKARFVGAWANRPRDVAHLAKFTGKETERPLNWQVISLSGPWTDWMDAPILYLASHEAPIFDDSDYEKLKSFVKAGGLLFTQADGDSKEFNQFAELLAMKIFDGEELKDLPADHFIYNALFKPTETFPLKAISNGTRVMMLHSPVDLAKRWQGKNAKTDRPAFELGANMFIYATGMSVPRNRLDTLAVDDVPGAPTVKIPIARLKYAGNWDPEPWAWQRMAKLFRKQTNAGLDIVPTEIEKLSASVAPIAHLTGTATMALSDAQIAAIKKYVDAGGILLIDPCGGAPSVAQSIHDNLLNRAFPGKIAEILPADQPLVSGTLTGTANLVKAQVRPYVYKVMGQRFTRPMMLESGDGAVIVSDLDLTSGLLGSSTYGIVGYEPAYAAKFVSNLILWTFNYRGAAVWATTQPSTSAN